MTGRFGIRALALAAALSAAVESSAAPAPGWPAPMDSLMRHVAEPGGFSPLDLDLLINYRTAPPPAPSAITTLLRRPHSLDSLVPALRQALSRVTVDGVVRAESAWPWIGVASPSPLKRRYVPDYFTHAAHRLLEQYVAPFDSGERAFLLREAPGLFRQQVEDTLLNPIARERERLRGDVVTDSVMRLAARLDGSRLAEAARDLDSLLFLILESHRKGGVRGATDLMRMLRLKNRVVIGTPGDDVHRLEDGIVFDPGGNDRYQFPDSARPGSWLMVIDLEGDDTYVSDDSMGGAAALLSVQILADLKGNDVYRGGDFAFGSALMGYARLFDAEGDDVYEGRCASLGFAFHGVGVLQDRAGNDSYSSAYLSQAASSSFGLALLLDEAGDDSYASRPVFVDDIRYRDHFLSLSQGFSTGMAPRHGGGIAVLWDLAGDDSYVADIFGQGAGYWFGWGLMMDDAGDDRFRAYQYAQGAGVHFAAGTLLDAAGDDWRFSKGVSQGCGHDGGFGLLADFAGDDSSTATDMSAGAGSANGLGALVDFAGDDAYAMGNPSMTLGHGDMRRDRGSTGFFWDARGRDAYPAPPPEKIGEHLPSFPKNGAAWRVYDGKGKGYGHGLDGE